MYSFDSSSLIEGEFRDNTVKFRYKETDAEGSGWFRLEGDGNRFVGRWTPKGKDGERQALMNVVHPLWRNFMMEITPETWRASVNSITALAWNLGWGVSVVFGGQLIERTAGLLGDDVDGYALPMLLTIALYLAAIATEAAFFWHERERGRIAPASR